jgi:hypothetical protein
MHSAKLLKLTVITSLPSSSLKKGKVYTINAQGLEDSRRDKFDGNSYFGTERRLAEKIVNDIVIPVGDTNSRTPGRNFVITYEPDHDYYSIRDLGSGYGVFARLDKEVIIRDNLLLQMGESYIVFNLIHS